uniref:Cyclin-dependent kinases regulatory subunit n=1 Tax=Oncorhynchus tshawytscha TaxID=74940 RepID=A0AAZ3NSM8_ONCTS
MSQKQIYYSDKYDDEKFEYRHVMLPKDIAKRVPKTHLMSETEWRNLGVQQSQGWIHYMIHQPAPHLAVPSSTACSLISRTEGEREPIGKKIRGWLEMVEHNSVGWIKTIL